MKANVLKKIPALAATALIALLAADGAAHRSDLTMIKRVAGRHRRK